ncbi:hypothetical protein FRC11_006074 [Ceratobasidium sp. 423]|nr:hypothetical protein FRC11_006074 [Ceratobasidium sp. 423]
MGPRLPDDVLYLIAKLSSFEARASLVRCNKWLYTICTPLLFQEISIYTPRQLVQPYENKKAMGMLSQTKSLILGKNEHDKADYIIGVLSATVSLQKLQLLQCGKWPGDLDRPSGLVEKLHELASNPRFLPELQVVVGA